MGDQIGVHPADHTGINIGDLEEGEGPLVAGAAARMQHQAHPPIYVLRLAGEEVVLDDHGHAWLEVQEDDAHKRCPGYPR